jgi:hypothetical protein
MLRTSLLALLGCGLLASSVCAQFQASNRTARRLAVEVDAIHGAFPTAITIEGPASPAGLPFVLAFELLAAADDAHSYLSPPLMPIGIDLAAPFVFLLTGGVLPPSGILPLTLGPTGIGAGAPIDVVVVSVDPNTATLIASNNTRRITTAKPPGFVLYTPDTPLVLPADYNEIEQADVDGDGDPETLQLSCTGTLTLMATVKDTFDPNPIWQDFVAGASAAEFADFDNDNWYDLVVSVDGLAGAVIFRNNGRAPGAGSQLGPWRGFTRLPFGTIAWDFASVPTAPLALDVETADVDGDGRIDFALACAQNPTIGLENRLLRNTTVPGGRITFTEITRPNLNPTPFLDDSEDLEFYDLDNDGDMDLVIANYEGPATIYGVEWVYINDGTGVFARRSITTPPNMDNTLDVMVADLNNDGAPDIYAGNFVDPATGMPVPDALYLTVGGVPLSWADRSTLLPDNAGFTGPPSERRSAWPTSDVEYLDTDETGATAEILIASGPKCGTLAPTAAGLRYLAGFNGPNTPFFSLPTDIFLPPVVQTIGINDIETGDWQGEFSDVDIGLSTNNDFFNSFGLILLRK